MVSEPSLKLLLPELLWSSWKTATLDQYIYFFFCIQDADLLLGKSQVLIFSIVDTGPPWVFDLAQ